MDTKSWAAMVNDELPVLVFNASTLEAAASRAVRLFRERSADKRIMGEVIGDEQFFQLRLERVKPKAS